MSPKNSSLALDEMKEQIQESEIPMGFEPQLDLIVNARLLGSSIAITEISGRVTVSF